MHRILIDTEFGLLLNYEELWNHSPVKFANRATTPTLFIHGAADNLVPLGQSEEMFVALQLQGVPSRLIRYPGKGHGFGDPPHAMASVMDWFAEHLGGLAPTATEDPTNRQGRTK
jgi:dipeptidyl aminopeptidase/acylaminoacyl peptidase